MNQITASTRNPVLNAPEDITDELLRNIIANNLDSLTINYEFTCRDFRAITQSSTSPLAAGIPPMSGT